MYTKFTWCALDEAHLALVLQKGKFSNGSRCTKKRFMCTFYMLCKL